MEEGLIRLKTGNFNEMKQEPQPDGSVVITLHKRGEKRVFKFRVKNLYQENEEILEHEVVEVGPPQFIQGRMRAAKEGIK